MELQQLAVIVVTVERGEHGHRPAALVDHHGGTRDLVQLRRLPLCEETRGRVRNDSVL